MDFQVLVFYSFALLLVGAGIGVIVARNPVHAALFLVLAFFSGAGLWMLLEAEFLAISLVLVYVGAVMVLFLFVVMMLDINLDQLREGFWKYFPIGALVALLMVGELWMVVSGRDVMRTGQGLPPAAADASNTREIGLQLYTTYLYPFELAAVVLLVAIVAAIALTLRRRKGTKYQNPAEQVRVKRADRVRMVSIPATGKTGE
ncbi:MAG: NADH-quinone oxidoreductase subunit J [Pseudomonadota bacterium]|nr:NADH-quinone oxidoreductase subunit J [Pseudomonadota bacterium]